MTVYHGADAIDALVRALDAAQKASTKASDARSALPAGSSRARVTTANARWMRASEHRDRCEAALRAALASACIPELAEAHKAASAKIDAAYWAFTRQANAKPPSVAVPGAYRLRTMIDDEVRRRGEVVAHG